MKITRGIAAVPMILASAPAAAAGQVDPQGSGPIVAALMCSRALCSATSRPLWQ